MNLAMLSDDKRKHLLKTAYELRASLETLTPRKNHTRPIMAVCAEHDHMQGFDITKLWFWRARKNAKTGAEHMCGYLAEQFPKDAPYFSFRTTLIPKSAQKTPMMASAFVEEAIRQKFKFRRAGDIGVSCSCGDSS